MTMKNGFSTINRLLGKQRDSNSNLSKSTSNLSVTKSTVNINDSSQLHQNRITPLPIATSNAPFEQTFRITVLLPRDQLYVARLGAKVRLEKLKQLVCENKQLDANKYEFQHPADPSQIFSCDLTIGAVGLSEIRLCNKSLSLSSEYNNTLRLDAVDATTSSRRNSFSSSKFSRNSKNISNTPSLYSSNYSLNSIGSSGIDSSNYCNISPEIVPISKSTAPIVPTRKKRLAPRPPSHNSTAVTIKANETSLINEMITNPNYSVVSTNKDLNKSNLLVDCNGNTKGSLQNHNELCTEQCQETQRDVLLKCQSTLSIVTNFEGNDGGSTLTLNQPEPSPRRKGQTLLTKKPVPMAPPRTTTRAPNEKTQDSEFVESTKQVQPVPLPRVASRENLVSEVLEEQTGDKSKNVSKVLMNQTEDLKKLSIETSKALTKELLGPVEVKSISLKHDNINSNRNLESNSAYNIAQESIEKKEQTQVLGKESISLVNCTNLILNEHRSDKESTLIVSKDPDLSKHATTVETITPVLSNDQIKIESTFVESNTSTLNTSVSDKNSTELPLEIEQVKDLKSTFIESSVDDAPLDNIEEKSLDPSCNSYDSIPNLEIKHKSFIESSSEDDEAVKVYDLKLGKTVVKTLSNHKIQLETEHKEFNQQNSPPENIQVEATDLVQSSEKKIVNGVEPNADTDVAVEFSDINAVKKSDKIEDSPIIEENIKEKQNSVEEDLEKPSTPQESSEEKIYDVRSLEHIESNSVLKQTENSSPEKSSDLTEPNQADQMTGNDCPKSSVKKPLFSTLERLGANEELEFKQHVKAAELEIELLHETAKNNMAARSSSFLSRDQTTDEHTSRRRRSSSEVSIGESPSLLSIGVMKSILLNSRKNSLSSSSEVSAKTSTPTECDIQPMEEPSPKNNNKFKTINNINNTKPRSEEKIYRYSGPPNIQFSTWSERPKVQVAVKNEHNSSFDETTSNTGQKTNTTNRTTLNNGKTDLGVQRNNQNISSDGSLLDLVQSTEKVILREPRLKSPFGKEIEKPSLPNSKPKFLIGSRTSWSVRTSTNFNANANGSNNLFSSNLPTLRPTSIASSISNSVTDNSQQQIFGQGTLRKTGFKEKILSPQDTPGDTVDGSKPIINFTLKKHQTTANQTPQITIKNNPSLSSSKTATATPTLTPTTGVPKFFESRSVPEAPPPPPIIRAVVTKHNTIKTHIDRSISADPRDQLLSAIRNFNRDELKNKNI